MELRQEQRFEPDQEITLTLLGEGQPTFAGRIVNISGKGMFVWSADALMPGDAVQIEFGDTMMLGEVIYCQAQPTGQHLGIKLEHALYHRQELAVLAKRLLGSSELSPAYEREVKPR